ncbi:MAG TPA: TonB family protein [Candidatus Acidoferrum sp.]
MSRDLQANSLNLLGHPQTEPELPVSIPAPISENRRVNPFNLLGQAQPPRFGVLLPGRVQPKFNIAWNSFHQNFLSGLPVFFSFPRIPRAAARLEVFRDCRVEPNFPRRAVIAAALVYAAALIFPWPELPAASRRNSAFENAEVTWSGPIEDLPLLHTSRARAKSPAAKEPEKPVAAEGTEAFHPRQRIYTEAPHPTHPRQTLVNPAAPATAPQFVPQLPNIVQLAASAAPVRPRIEISEQTLAKLRPRKNKVTAASPDAPPADLPNLEQRPAEMNIANSASGPARPKLEINAGAAPRLAERKQSGESAAEADEPAAISSAGNGAASTLIALSSNPGPAAPIAPVPQGNLSARVAISPEGKPGAAGNASAAATGGAGTGSGAAGGAGNSPVAISISGGAPKPNAGVSGLGGAGKLTLPRTTSAMKRPDPNASDDTPERTGPPDFAALPPGAKPEQIFSARRVYTMNVNMPNLNSATGSWIIHFSELRVPGAIRRTGELNAPVPMRKVDPKYPQTLVQDRVEGEVILYAVIRHDGSVDSVQLVRGVDTQLDANSIAAFTEWKFEPATKEGQPIDLEAIVHIPFRAPDRR